ncbi:type II/IV secretion system protein [bacterium]|nr:type II/IV secretion system protein [bacterium]
MSLSLSFEFLLNLLHEYGVVDAEQKDFIESRREYYESQYRAQYKEEPFITELMVFIAQSEKMDMSEDMLLRLIAGRAGCDFEVIDPLKVDAQLVNDTLSASYGMSNLVVPLRMQGEYVLLAMADPFRSEVIEQLSVITNHPIIPVVASAKQIRSIITDLLEFKKSINKAASDFTKDTMSNLEQLTNISSGTNPDDRHIVNAVDYMLKFSVEQGASDIHIEPKRDNTTIRFRLDGILHTIYTFPADAHLPFVSRLKMLARMDIAEKRRPQDGRIKIQLSDTVEVEVRASTVPVVSGEKMVLRILESGTHIRRLNEIGFVSTQLSKWRESMQKGYGMLLVTGPTGSGKSTTLYSTLKEIASPEVNILSVEDPIEIVLDEINQIGVNVKAGITFAVALRHILRQDPDIVMVGEIRDKETADHAIQAALTGHLVFSTLHTNDTAATVERLIDLKVEAYLIASVLNGIVAQRLVRKVCPYCAYERPMSEKEKITLNLPLDEEYNIKDAEGCVRCRHTGYSGRTAIIEFMPITQKTRSLISKKATTEELRDNAVMDGMVTLRESAIRKLADGITTFDEIVKALYYE